MGYGHHSVDARKGRGEEVNQAENNKPVPRRVTAPVSGVDLTQQQFKAETDINTITGRYLRNGNQPRNFAPAKFGDYSAMDFLDMQNIIVDAKRQFEELPSKVRRRFNNDPFQLMRFIEDPENKLEAEKLGILEPKKEPELSEMEKLTKATVDGIREALRSDPEAQPFPKGGKPASTP